MSKQYRDYSFIFANGDVLTYGATAEYFQKDERALKGLAELAASHGSRVVAVVPISEPRSTRGNAAN